MQPYLDKHGSNDPLSDRGSRERDLVAIVGKLVRELHPQRTKSYAIALSSRLEQDLGIDSLARTELILRVERAFRLRLPIDVLGQVETVADLLDALEQAPASKGVAHDELLTTLSLPVVPAAVEARTLVDVLEWHVAHHPDRLHLTVLEDDGTKSALTYSQLAETRGASPPALSRVTSCPATASRSCCRRASTFSQCFFGVLYAGAAPVPIYPPMRLAQIRGPFAATGRHSAQRRRTHPRHHARRAGARRAVAGAGGKSGVRRKRGDAGGPTRATSRCLLRRMKARPR